MENGVAHDNLTKNDVKVVVPLKHLSNFWRHLDTPLINCEVELILTWFKRNKYRSQMSIQPQNNSLNCLINPTFTNVHRLFVLSFPWNNNTDGRYSFSNYYVPKVKVNGFNVLIDGKSFFDLTVKNDEEAYEKNIDMSNNSDYTY